MNKINVAFIVKFENSAINQWYISTHESRTGSQIHFHLTFHYLPYIRSLWSRNILIFDTFLSHYIVLNSYSVFRLDLSPLIFLIGLFDEHLMRIRSPIYRCWLEQLEINLNNNHLTTTSWYWFSCIRSILYLPDHILTSQMLCTLNLLTLQ